MTTPSPTPPRRNLILRTDGKLVNVPRRQGQLFVCATGCCCGHTERGHAAVPTDLLDQEWERRKWRNRVHLTIAGCLGPCTLSNVAMLLFDGRTLYFQSLNSPALVLALLDYVDTMLAADAYLPPPPALAELHFTGFRWEDRPDGLAVDDIHRGRRAEADKAVDADGFVFLTHADTDLLVLDKAAARLASDFPPVRAYGLSHLKSDDDVDAFLDNILPGAEVIVVRLLGGRASFAHGLDRVVEHARRHGKWLLCLPGTDALDPELTALSTTGVPVSHEALAYLQLGGVTNYEHMLRFLADHLLAGGFGFDRPVEQPRHGIYHPDLPLGATLSELRARHDLARPTLGVLFYRSHVLSGNTDFVDAIVREVEARGANALPVYAYSLKDGATPDGGLPDALRYFVGADGSPSVDAVIATMSFAMGQVNTDGPTQTGWSVEALERLGVPVLQAITVGGSHAQWDASQRGLTPVDTAMNVALPEFDGRIITVPISFKEAVESGPSSLGAPVVAYVPRPDRIARAVGLGLRFAVLRRKPNADKRVAVMLTNYNAKASRIGNAVGLDTPASVLRLLHALQAAGYDVGVPDSLPPDGDALLAALIDRCSYDADLLTDAQLANAAARVPFDRYAAWFAGVPDHSRQQMQTRWGPPPGETYVHAGHIVLAGLHFGNVFVAIQPPRGYGMDPNLIYHQPDLPPTHHYHAAYAWLREEFRADAVVHMGKHGTLEWLPGKSIGLSETCYPDLLLGDLPLFYPFIVNDPGEGAQAKRRTHAVVVDHMTPPMTTADVYGKLDELTRLVDEYYQVEALDPSKLPMLQQQIWELVVDARLDTDITLMITRMNQQGDHTHDWDPQVTDDGVPSTLADMRSKDFAHLIENLDGYLCELGSALIRGGLHTLGDTYTGERLRDLALAMVRVPNLEVPSLRAGVAEAFGLSLDQLVDDLGARIQLSPGLTRLADRTGRGLATTADALDAIDGLCLGLVEALQAGNWACMDQRTVRDALGVQAVSPGLSSTLDFIGQRLMPSLDVSARDEIGNLLRGLAGGYVPAGPSGAPTRGMAHVLPTGRNFYAIDPRTMPSRSAWRVGQQLAAELVERHRRDTGAYPESVGLSIWGTSAMRTHGDDIAQVFALLGVRPVWQSASQRLIGTEVTPLDELGRPRVDVVCRISGFFRDAFPHVLGILDDAVRQVAALDEPLDQNFLRARYLADTGRLEAAGLDSATARRKASYRIFGSKPGTYGAGILPLIDEGNWQTTADFARAYVAWGGYAYTGDDFGVDAQTEFETVLGRVQVAAKNQDNREHDIFDSDDYLQFHGGMIATIRALSGSAPRRYFGDTSDPARATVRDLKQEALRVFRTRVVNPKWIESITRHGYKGALEMAATVDYLFGYDATSDVLDDWMYEEVTRAYIADPAMQAFFARSSPWALKDMSARLLEAVDRGLWEQPSAAARATLEAAYLSADTALETRTESPAADVTGR
jgi:cobaltochelatase CobN